jgi:hypothetical protein
MVFYYDTFLEFWLEVAYEFKNTKTLSLKITSLQALSLVRANWVHRYIIYDTKESQKLCRADFSADNRQNVSCLYIGRNCATCTSFAVYAYVQEDYIQCSVSIDILNIIRVCE